VLQSVQVLQVLLRLLLLLLLARRLDSLHYTLGLPSPGHGQPVLKCSGNIIHRPSVPLGCACVTQQTDQCNPAQPTRHGERGRENKEGERGGGGGSQSPQPSSLISHAERSPTPQHRRIQTRAKWATAEKKYATCPAEALSLMTTFPFRLFLYCQRDAQAAHAKVCLSWNAPVATRVAPVRPVTRAQRDDVNGCTIIVTARSRHVFNNYRPVSGWNVWAAICGKQLNKTNNTFEFSSPCSSAAVNTASHS